jgi:hypothetical protein
VADLVVDVPREHAQPDPDLRRREAGPGGVEHGVGEVFDQLAQLAVEVDDLLGTPTQHRVAEQADGLDGHGDPRDVRRLDDAAASLRTEPCGPAQLSPTGSRRRNGAR